MKRTEKKKATLKQIVIYCWMILILLMLTTVASYTWFSLSRTPRVSDMNMYVYSKTGLELSLDPTSEEWVTQLDLREALSVTTPLRPVTWVEEQQRFYAASYGLDGRLLNFEFWEPLSDERNANKDNMDGYYIKMTIYARSDSKVDVSLSPAVEVDEGINGSGTYLFGVPIWNEGSVTHDNGGLGAETAVRIGLRITPVDESGELTGEESTFFIYEPNCDAHMDHSVGYVPTNSVTGAPGLVAEEYLIRQTHSIWTESDPVQRDVVIKQLGEFVDERTLFTLMPGAQVRIDIYIWLEGQDVDCTNQINNAQIVACIQFAAVSEGQSGLIPIE